MRRARRWMVRRTFNDAERGALAGRRKSQNGLAAVFKRRRGRAGNLGGPSPVALYVVVVARPGRPIGLRARRRRWRRRCRTRRGGRRPSTAHRACGTRRHGTPHAGRRRRPAGAIGGVTGRGAVGAGATGFGAAGFAAVGLRAGFRAAFFAVLRAGAFFAAARFAGFFFAAVFFFATFFFAVLRALVFRAAALFFLLVVRFFPLFFVAMACAPILP